SRGFYVLAVDYVWDAEGISLDDVDLVVRNCYIMPVEEMDRRLANFDRPNYLTEEEREQVVNDPLYLSTSNKMVTVSHHLAHAYSAFAACPFDEGAVMIVDGVGSYAAAGTEGYPAAARTTPTARGPAR